MMAGRKRPMRAPRGLYWGTVPQKKSSSLRGRFSMMNGATRAPSLLPNGCWGRGDARDRKASVESRGSKSARYLMPYKLRTAAQPLGSNFGGLSSSRPYLQTIESI